MVMKMDIGISDKDRKAVAAGLSNLLADTYTLYLKTHSFHWNVEGPMFQTLHIMFMEQYTEMWNALDIQKFRSSLQLKNRNQFLKLIK
jgi:starvation-inducible DNA-binding protein